MTYIKPLISIGLPVYNMHKTLARSLDSIINQTYKNLEIIISDNCSNDGSYELCCQYQKKDSRIKLYRQFNTISAKKNFNFVLKLAKGEYFAWQASDDYRSLDCLEVFLNNILKENVGVVFSKYNLLDDSTQKLESYRPHKLSSNKIFATQRFIFRPIPCMIYGLYRTTFIKKIRENKLLKENFDWTDAFTNIIFIYSHGGHIINSNKSYITFSYKSQYKPKVIRGKYINPLPYSIRLLSMTNKVGFICIFGSIRITLLSYFLNLVTLKNQFKNIARIFN